jgi:hypothetical protein
MAEEQTSGIQENEVAEAAASSVLTAATSALEQAARAAIGGGQGTSGNMTTGAGGKPPANSGGGTPVGEGEITTQFAGLPIEALICAPIIAAARGQQELTAVYVETLIKLAYDDGTGKVKTSNILEFDCERPIIKGGKPDKESYKVNAPLLSLVPVPAFMMDELTVDFKMEVKEQKLQKDTNHADIATKVRFNSWWGFDAEITGKVSSDSEYQRTTDSSAKYNIHAKAIQRPPTEGMAKLISLFAQAMEPMDLK